MTHERPRRWWRFSAPWVVLPVAAVVLLGIAVGTALLTFYAVGADNDKAAMANVAVPQAITTSQLCDSGGEVARALEAAGLCDQADRVRAEAKRVDADVPAPEALVPDRDELLGYVRGQVVAYCAGRENCQPDATVLVETVARYLEEHPPTPGKDATPEQIADAARTVLTQDPDLFRGQQGPQGEPGPGPSNEQVAQSVAGFCAANGNCQGAPGPQGPGVVAFRFERNDANQCEAVVTFSNPATGEERTDRRAAGDAACAPPAPPEEESGGILPGG